MALRVKTTVFTVFLRTGIQRPKQMISVDVPLKSCDVAYEGDVYILESNQRKSR